MGDAVNKYGYPSPCAYPMEQRVDLVDFQLGLQLYSFLVCQAVKHPSGIHTMDWRQYDNRAEQDAVRELLRRMNIEVVEMAENREHTRFCGTSLYRPAPPRNLKMAPKRFVEDAEGMFVPYTEEEQMQLMKEHCRQYQTEHVVAYCHYCTEGLRLAGQPHYHIAELLFPNSI